MQHTFKIKQKDGKVVVRKSTLIKLGQKEASAMSITVGKPTAVAAQVIFLL